MTERCFQEYVIHNQGYCYVNVGRAARKPNAMRAVNRAEAYK
jgi:hypothetical protein